MKRWENDKCYICDKKVHGGETIFVLNTGMADNDSAYPICEKCVTNVIEKYRKKKGLLK